MVMAGKNDVRVSLVKHLCKSLLKIEGVGPLSVLSERIGRFVHENNFPVPVRGGKVIFEPGKLRV